MQALRAIVAPLTRPLEARGAQMFGQALANASDAMTVKGRGDDACKLMNGKLKELSGDPIYKMNKDTNPTIGGFGWNSGKDLVGGGLSVVGGRVLGGSAGNYVNAFLSTGFAAVTKGL